MTSVRSGSYMFFLIEAYSSIESRYWSGVWFFLPIYYSVLVFSKCFRDGFLQINNQLSAQNVEIWRHNVECHDLIFCMQRMMLRITHRRKKPFVGKNVNKSVIQNDFKRLSVSCDTKNGPQRYW